MRRLAAALLGLACAGALAAQRPAETRSERLASEGVQTALEAGDCKLAVERLNDGLAAKYPGFYALAGAMYESGLCLKPNWERAVQLYQRAQQAGDMAGPLKLVAGYAEHGRDPAAALWWAQQPVRDDQPLLALPAPCQAGPLAAKDPDAFVATLRAWPAGRLAACVYTAGVLAAVAGEAGYPRYAAAHSLAGKVEMRFVPATGTIEWRTLELDEKQMLGAVSGDDLRDRSSRGARASLEASLREAGDRVLRRFGPPPAVDPGWQVTRVFVFELHDE